MAVAAENDHEFAIVMPIMSTAARPAGQRRMSS
jgi:hypothetical protein